MNNPMIKWLLAGCGILVVLLGLEWLILTRPETIDTRPNTLDNAASTQLPTLDFAAQRLENSQEMLKRPLFVQGRRPVDDETESDEIETVSRDIEQFQLMGVYQKDDQLIALIKDTQTPDKYLKKTIDDTLADWEIKQILPTRIIIERAGREQTLLLRKPKPKVIKPNSRFPKPTRRPMPKGKPVRQKHV